MAGDLTWAGVARVSATGAVVMAGPSPARRMWTLKGASADGDGKSRR